MATSDYEAQAQAFLDRFGFTVKAAHKDAKCPKWCDDKHIHGDRYRVTIRRNGERKSISFDFWNSYRDMQEGNDVTAYDVLSCISSDASMPTDPDEVVAELGEMKPSQAIATAKFAAKLQAFFTESEREALAEIQ